jgi:hypothetical protein
MLTIVTFALRPVGLQVPKSKSISYFLSIVALPPRLAGPQMLEPQLISHILHIVFWLDHIFPCAGTRPGSGRRAGAGYSVEITNDRRAGKSAVRPSTG